MQNKALNSACTALRYFFGLDYVHATLTQDMNLHHTSTGLKCHLRCKLQAQVYDILPQTSAVTDYAIGLKKRQLAVFHWCSNGSTFVTDKSNYIKRFFYIYLSMLLTPSQIKPKPFESRWNSSFSPLNLKDVPRVYVHALTPCRLPQSY